MSERRNARRASRRACAAFVGLIFILMSAVIGPILAQEQPDSVATAPPDTTPSEVTESRNLIDELEVAFDSVQALDKRLQNMPSKEASAVLRVQGRRYVERINDIQSELIKLIPKLDEMGRDTSQLRERFARVVKDEYTIYIRALREWSEEIDELRTEREDLAIDQLAPVENRINEVRDRIDRILDGHVELLTVADSLGIKTGDEWEKLDQFLVTRAETYVGRLQIAVKQRDELKRVIKDAQKAKAAESEIADTRTRLQFAERRVHSVANSLEATAKLLDRRGFDTAKYRQFMIRETGEITDRVLDPKVLIGILKGALSDFWEWLKKSAPTFLVKLLILSGFVILFKFSFRFGWFLIHVTGLAKVSRLMKNLVQRMVSPFGTIVGLFVGMWFLGVNPTTLLAGVGVLGVVVGLALQDSLSNLAAGLFILLTRPYDEGDVVVTGAVTGTVKQMGLANTTIVTFDNRRLYVPNRKIWGEVIENRSAEFVRRVDLVVRIGYNEDLDRAMDILRDLLGKNERVLPKPEPALFVADLADSWIEIAVRPWVRNEDWWPLLTELPRLVRLRFAEEGIDIPVPRREVSLPGEAPPIDDAPA